MRDEFLERGVNVEFSGGEKKRVETLQLAVLDPKFAILDEIDSGLDVDALRDVSRRVEAMTAERGSGCSPSRTTRVCSPSCAPTACTCSWAGAWWPAADRSSPTRLEETGYEGFATEHEPIEAAAAPAGGADPFADPLA